MLVVGVQTYSTVFFVPDGQPMVTDEIAHGLLAVGLTTVVHPPSSLST